MDGCSVSQSDLGDEISGLGIQSPNNPMTKINSGSMVMILLGFQEFGVPFNIVGA